MKPNTNDVPRDKDYWPTIPPEQFTIEQLKREIHVWAGCSTSGPDTIGYKEWKKYSDELKRREQPMKTLNNNQIKELLEIIQEVAQITCDDTISRDSEGSSNYFYRHYDEYKARLTDLFGTKD